MCTAGVLETQGSDGTFYDAPERQEQVPRQPRTASEAPPVIHITPPAPPSTPIASPALSAAQIAPETPTMPRCSVLHPLCPKTLLNLTVPKDALHSMDTRRSCIAART